MPLQMRGVFSSHVDRIGYEPETNELHVTYTSGKTAIYSGVPKEIADHIMSSASIGSALHEHVKGKFDHRYD